MHPSCSPGLRQKEEAGVGLGSGDPQEGVLDTNGIQGPCASCGPALGMTLGALGSFQAGKLGDEAEGCPMITALPEAHRARYHI